MNLIESIEKSKWMSKAGYHKEALDVCNEALTYLNIKDIAGETKVKCYTPVWGEPIMTKYGKSKRVDRYDKVETKTIEFWKDRFYDLLLLFTQRYNRKMGIKPKKDKPFKRHGIETFMSTAQFGNAGPGYRNHLD